MSIASSDAAYRKLADNSKLGLKLRIDALSKIARPSKALLTRLCRSGKPKLMKLAADRLREVQIKKDPQNEAAIADLLR